MRQWMVRLTFAILLVAGARELGAQVVETPEPFDSAGRVQVVTPPLAARLKLEPPTWPVSGDYVEARLFARGDGAWVIAVQRRNGAVERFTIDAQARAGLRAAVSQAMEGAGRPTSSNVERPEMISEPARGAFVRNQTSLGAALYGPAVAALIGGDGGDGSTASAAYLLTLGGSFFISASIARTTPVSRAQNFLSTHAAVTGAGMAAASAYVLGGDGLDGKAYAAALLIGGLGGSTTGFRAGRPLTDAEAQAAGFGSTMSLLTAAGIMGTFGLFNEDIENGRGQVAGLIAATAAGYPLGLMYPRRARYVVTSGDVQTIWVPATIGVLLASTALPDDPTVEAASAILTTGLLTGAFIGDRFLVRPYDHTEGDARLIGLGAYAGGAMGAAFAHMAGADSPRAYLALASAGALGGLFLTDWIIEPRRAGMTTALRTGQRSGPRSGLRTGLPSAQAGPAAPGGTRGGITARVSPSGAAFAAARVRGTFPILSVQF